MKRACIVLGALLLVATLTSCAAVIAQAPPGSDIRLATAVDSTTYHASRKVFYLLWGLVPLGDNSTASMIPAGVASVRVRTYYDIGDALINMFLGVFTVTSRTIAVEGTYAPK